MRRQNKWTSVSSRPLCIAAFLVGLILLVACQVSVARGGEAGKKPIYINNLQSIYIGFSTKDATLAFQVLMTKVIGGKYPDFDIVMDFPEDIDAATAAIANNRCDILTLASLDFFRMRRNTTLEPLAILSKGDHATEPYLFLTPVDVDIDTIIRKADRTLIVEQSGGGDVATAWLSALLMERGLGQVAEFFAAVQPAKPNRVVLPLFFGQADTCLVSESTFRVTVELNPQVEKKIRILDRSPGLVNLLICGTQNLEPAHRRWVMDELAHLNDYPEGRQALTIMQMKHFFLCEPEHLKATEALFNRHQQLLGRKK